MPLGMPEIILISVVLIVIFGSTKLPQLGDGLGRAIKNFKRAVSSQSEIDVSPKDRDKDKDKEKRGELKGDAEEASEGGKPPK